MDASVFYRRYDWPEERWATDAARTMTPVDAARGGVGPYPIIRSAVWESLQVSLFCGSLSAIRTLLPPSDGAGSVTWYGQQEAHRVAYYDICRSIGMARFGTAENALLDVFGALAGATGWWWAYDDVCVLSERPTILATEPTPAGVHNEQRLHRDDGPALRFVDGHSVCALHGTIVPEWVVQNPTVERIATERNVEIRRCAIEKIGWDTYIDGAGLTLLDRADDQGNPGCTLALDATPEV
ncbi:MAG: DUF6745 domain-containing protein [Rhodococcus sp. (in: high G+C Gram-positive bacteria)]